MGVMMQDSQRNKTALGLLLLDLDYFKKINDSFGHLAGDAVLKQTAETLIATIRAEDFVCRWGGEEFLIVVRDCDAAQLMLLAEIIRGAIQVAHFNYRDKPIAVTASIGAAARLQDEGVEHLIHRADRALYQAKNGGRNLSILAN